MLGTVQTLVVCVSGSAGAQGPCPDGQVQSVTQAYVIAPSQAALLDAATEPIDYTLAGALWSFSFSVVVGLWLVSRNAGVILNFIRHG